MKTIRLLQDVIGGDGEPLKEGSSYSLNDASALHWLNRGLAVEVEPRAVQQMHAQVAPVQDQPATTLTVSRKKK